MKFRPPVPFVQFLRHPPIDSSPLPSLPPTTFQAKKRFSAVLAGGRHQNCVPQQVEKFSDETIAKFEELKKARGRKNVTRVAQLTKLQVLNEYHAIWRWRKYPARINQEEGGGGGGGRISRRGVCLFSCLTRMTQGKRTIFEGLSRSSSPVSCTDQLESFPPENFELSTAMTAKDVYIALPSDQSWRLKNYFKLLDKQKAKTLILHMMIPEEVEEAPRWEQVIVSQPETKRAKISGSSSISSEGSVVTSQGSDISWSSPDLIKAATLLKSGSDQVSFHDEDEMRRIFALLYDVFRYKNILNDALRETGFFQKFPQHKDNHSLLWLLFYDLHKRRFLPRVHADAVFCNEAFEKIGLSDLESNLWSSRIKLAASLARARIKNNALRLNQLLPHHLRDERFVSVEETPVTGWINTFQKSKKEIIESIEKLGLKLQSKHETVLTKNDFRFDHLCPKLLLCHPLQRPDLAQSHLIRNHTIILQDRAFCIGPALMGKILTDIPLRGTVAQTHVNTPRTTAYLASVLVENERLDKLVAFGAGERLLEYQTYLHELGVNNCEIYAQRFAEIHPEAAILENLVAVVATPPNSYTGVTDPVDLICSRGGDMNMLKALTQLKMDESALGYLEEQKETLKYCMSLPQVQIILYETHSVAPTETFEMVKDVIETVNKMAREKHEEEHRLMLEKEEAEEKANKAVFIPGKPSSREQKEREAQEAKEAKEPREVVIPPCDLFEEIALPSLCSHGLTCFTEEGCYLARIQRKEIISLDAKYMIKIAEARGLFGSDPNKKKVAAAARAPKKQERRRTSSAKIKVKRVKLEIDRLAAPTQSTIYRTKRESNTQPNVDGPPCPRHQSHTLENLNKVLLCASSVFGDSIVRSEDSRRNSIVSKKSQEESIRRLSKPLKRSKSPNNFTSEIKPRFWRCATAKSVEDLIRTLRKKRKSKRIFKVEDYFFFKDQGLFLPHENSVLSETGIIDEEHLDKLSRALTKNTVYERTLTEPRISKHKSEVETYFTDVKIVKPFLQQDVLRIMSYGTVSEPGTPKTTPKATSLTALDATATPDLVQQCLGNASIIFNKIDEAIEENKKITERKINPRMKKLNPYSHQGKFKNKDFSPLEALSKIEEINNIIDLKKNHRTDIILPPKYLPGEQTTTQQEEFVKNLHKKLEKLQQTYKRWSKWKEAYSVDRLSAPKRVRKKFGS